MELKEYCAEVKRTLAETTDDNTHVLFGMVTEIGELVDVYKKNMASGKPIDSVNVQEEVGDLMWYVANFCNIHGFDLGDILERNVNKLKTRYPYIFTADAHDNRNLDKERKVLEGSANLELLDDKDLLSFTEGL